MDASSMKVFPTLDFLGGPALAALFLLFLGLETWRPLRRWVQSRWERLLTNGAVAATAAVTARLSLVPAVVWVASRVEQSRWGLLFLLPVSPLIGTLLAFLLLDYTVYLWHRLNHMVPFLWRFHSVHHTDLDLDVSTAFRFHFGELLLSVLYRCAQVTLIGVGPALALVYEIALEGATEFHHSNWRLPLPWERALNRVFVTPRMHGIHHSIVERETNSNWSVIFSWWDRLHRTARLGIPQEAITIGVPAYRDARDLTFLRLLAMPFRRQRPTWLLPNGDHPEREAAERSPRLAP
jgi:sterol desaturase/sphingolipid hydroxylase (fatty acid hydroxylase superfamily)